jgi:hypothetical protein
LVEQIVASVERDIEAPSAGEQQPEEHWGQSLVRLINSLDLSEWEALEIENPVEWVKSIRRTDQDRLRPYWDGEK